MAVDRERDAKREPGRARGSRNGVFVAATRFRRQPTASASVSVLNVPANRQTPPDRSLSSTRSNYTDPRLLSGELSLRRERRLFFAPFPLSKEAKEGQSVTTISRLVRFFHALPRTS